MIQITRVLAVVLLLIAIPGSPAAAQGVQTTLNFLYFGAKLNTKVAEVPVSIYGGQLRLDFRNSPWSLSGYYFNGSVESSSLPWVSHTQYRADVHYRFGPTDSNLYTYVGVLAGYGGTELGSPRLGESISASGARLGAEFRWGGEHGFYASGSAVYGPSWTLGWSGGSGTRNSSVTEFQANVGYLAKFGLGLELTYWWTSWNMSAGPVCSAVADCSVTLQGPLGTLFVRF